MLSTCAKVLQSLSYAGIKSTQVPHTYSVSQSLPSYVYLCRNRHPPKPVQFTIIFLYLRISQIWRVYPPSTSLHHRDIDWSTQQRYPTHIPSHKHSAELVVKCFNHSAMPESSPCRYPTHILSLNLYHRRWSCIAFVVKQTPTTITRFTVYTRISQIWRVYLASTFLNHRDTDWSNLHKYPTHILSQNHYQHMCICVGVGTQKPLQFTNM